MSERISEAEQAVMEVLWADSPLTAGQVTERVDQRRGWSDRTIKTMLARLLAKGVLAHEEDGRRYLYRPVTDRAAFVARETGKLVDRLFGGRSGPLVAQLAAGGRLDAEDIAEIEALLKAIRP